MSADELVTAAYGATNLLRLAGYLPQIWRVALDRDGAPAISCLGWSLWTAANATTAMYAWTQWRDLPLTLVNTGNALGCAAVVALTLGKRLIRRRRAAASDTSPARPWQRRGAVIHFATPHDRSAAASGAAAPRR